MSALTFDTYEAIQTLTSKGMSQEQAEGITQVVKQAQDAHLEQLATKGDINIRFERVDGEIRLVKWMLGLVIAGIFALLLKSFFGIG